MASIVIASVTYIVLIIISVLGCIIYSFQSRQRKRFEEEQRKEKSVRERTKFAQILMRVHNLSSSSEEEDSNALDETEIRELHKWKKNWMSLATKEKEESDAKEYADIYQVFQAEKKIAKRKSEFQKIKGKKRKKSQTISVIKKRPTGIFKMISKSAKSLGKSPVKSKSRFNLKRKMSLKLNKVSFLKQQQQSKQPKDLIRKPKSSYKVVTSLNGLKTMLVANVSKRKSRQMSSKWQKGKKQ